MEDQLISFETAKLAKEKGFNIPQEKCFCETQKSDIPMWSDALPEKAIISCYAPTQTTLQRWLRERHDIFIYAHYYDTDGTVESRCFYYIKCTFDKEVQTDKFKTYEEALEFGLRDGLRSIPKKEE